MSKLKARNTSLASHLAGSRGAGRHVSAERKYAKGKSNYLDDSDIAPAIDLADSIISLVAERIELGLGNSRLSDLLILGSAADVKRKLDGLVAGRRLAAFDLVVCEACGQTKEIPVATKKRLCCNKNLLRKVGESFSA